MQKVPAPSIWWCCPPPLVGASYSLKRGHSPYFLWISVLQRHRNYNMCQSTSWDIVEIKYRKRHKYTVNYGSNIAHLCNIVGKDACVSCNGLHPFCFQSLPSVCWTHQIVDLIFYWGLLGFMVLPRAFAKEGVCEGNCKVVDSLMTVYW